MAGKLPACVIDVGTGFPNWDLLATRNHNLLFLLMAIAIKESARVGDTNTRRVTKGVEDLDFFIGDEAFDATGYSVKVCL